MQILTQNRITISIQNLLKLNNEISTFQSVNENVDINIYPNPIDNGTLMIESHIVIIKIVIFDLAGKEQMTFSSPKKNQLEISNLAMGNYIIRFYGVDNLVITKKLVKL